MVNKTNVKIAVIVTVIFTILDYIAHVLNILPEIAQLPQSYFIYKIIILPIVLYILLERKIKSEFWICSLGALSLQVRYYFLGIYDIKTNLIMLVVHYVLIRISFIIYKRIGGLK